MSARVTCAAVLNGRGAVVDGRAGRPCQRWAVSGSKFCAVHGGSKKGLLSNPASLENRCVVTKKNGERCKRNAAPGTTVCVKHGATAPQTAAKAKERLLAMVEPALVELSRIVSQPTTSDSDRLRAIAMILDRTGYGPGSSLAIEVTVKPWEEAMQTIIRELPEADPLPELEAEVIEAEVVPVRVGSATPPSDYA